MSDAASELEKDLRRRGAVGLSGLGVVLYLDLEDAEQIADARDAIAADPAVVYFEWGMLAESLLGHFRTNLGKGALDLDVFQTAKGPEDPREEIRGVATSLESVAAELREAIKP